jgi:hypothetical protein
VPDWPLAAAQMGLSIALLVFAGLNVATFGEMIQEGRAAQPLSQTIFLGQTFSVPSFAQLGVAVVAVLLVLVLAYLFGMGWSARAAQFGLTVIGGLALLGMTVASGSGLTVRNTASPAELWWDQPADRDVRLLQKTLQTVSNYSTGEPNTIDVTVLVAGEPGSLLRWTLRDFARAVFVDRLGAEINSPVVITPLAEQNPALGSAYVGQDFRLRQHFAWPQGSLAWVNWLAYRRTPAPAADTVILWVRQDVQKLQSTGG